MFFAFFNDLFGIRKGREILVVPLMWKVNSRPIVENFFFVGVVIHSVEDLVLFIVFLAELKAFYGEIVNFCPKHL